MDCHNYARWEDWNDYHPVGCGCSKCFPHLLKPNQKVELQTMRDSERDEKRQEKR